MCVHISLQETNRKKLREEKEKETEAQSHESTIQSQNKYNASS